MNFNNKARRLLRNRLVALTLPTVLVISILVLLLLFFLLCFFNLDSLYYSRYKKRKQQQWNIESGFALFCTDSTFENSEHIKLFDGNSASQVHIKSERWGFYQLVFVANGNQTSYHERLIGKKNECNLQAAFWLMDQNRPLSLSGNTEIKGKIYVPKNGINYTRINSKNYSGEKKQDSILYLSQETMPVIDSTSIEYIDSLRKEAQLRNLVFSSESDYVSFSEDALYYKFENQMRPYNLSGHVILIGDTITLSSRDSLSDVLLLAKKVVLQDGFKGSAQIFATDSVIIGKNVNLVYPSGIYISNSDQSPYLSIASNSRVYGYAIVTGAPENENGIYETSFLQQDSSLVCGLIYVEGNAMIGGTVKGATYLRDCCYRINDYYYVETLVNAHIERCDNIAFPVFLKGDYQRKQIKIVH